MDVDLGNDGLVQLVPKEMTALVLTELTLFGLFLALARFASG